MSVSTLEILTLGLSFHLLSAACDRANLEKDLCIVSLQHFGVGKRPITSIGISVKSLINHALTRSKV
jgi:hypothetical protein